MLKLTKPVAIAIQASLGIALSAPLAATALAEGASANAATQNQATPTFRGGDLVRLRSGGPVMTVKSVHGNWVICTWWNEAFGQFRTVQQHAERSAYPPEHIHHLVEHILMLGRHVGPGDDWWDAWHVRLRQFIAA